MPVPSLSELLKRMVDMGGSDLQITVDSPPRVRLHGELKPLEDLPALGPVGYEATGIQCPDGRAKAPLRRES